MCRIYKYTGISEADTKKGQIRCDVNVNLMDDNGNYITPKVEIKNVNNLANVKLAILYEEKRQLESLKNSLSVIQRDLIDYSISKNIDKQKLKNNIEQLYSVSDYLENKRLSE